MEVTLKQTDSLLDLIVQEEPRRVTCNIEGPAGVGKSSIVRQFCTKRDFPLVEVNTAAAVTEPGDILGMPMREGGKTIYAPVFWALESNNFAEQLRKVKDVGKKVILMFDDFNRVPAQVLQSMMSIFLDYKVGVTPLAREVRIILTGNPSGSREYAARALDKAQTDRIQTIKVKFDIDEFIEYAISNGFNGEWTAFCKCYPEMFIETATDSKKKSSGTSGQTAVSPRSAEFASQALNTIMYRGHHLDSEIARIRLDAIVGEHIRAAFFTNLKTQTKILQPTEIIDGTIRENIFAEMLERPDLMYLTYIRLASYICGHEKEMNPAKISNVHKFIIRVEQDEVNALFLRMIQAHSQALSSKILDHKTFVTLQQRLWGER
jgi:hypothetical protein